MVHSLTSRRAAVAITAVAVTAIGLVGCSSGDAASDGPVTVTFAASTFGDPGLGPRLQELVDQFNAEQDDVIVEPASVPFPTFGQTILTQMGGGEGPDLVRFDMPEFTSAGAAGLLEPLDDLVDTESLDLQPGPDEFMSIDDVRYGIIFDTSNYVM